MYNMFWLDDTAKLLNISLSLTTPFRQSKDI
jgi:hypothetical protein